MHRLPPPFFFHAHTYNTSTLRSERMANFREPKKNRRTVVSERERGHVSSISASSDITYPYIIDFWRRETAHWKKKRTVLRGFVTFVFVAVLAKKASFFYLI